ncbi:MAG: tRNA (N(6)-L-threonylcarbamoyladenosine(37)-C(2))-methylthiotransferase MtaB, partial [Pseudomonadota bacterium]|nr:tRNA (N(6)-L-threonylcarbamoyladenosine(37)-C(2))-methylthiotransferase MtaB [Pseudomonadota bacterium]
LNTLRIVEDCGLTWLHVFPYSARQGTPAARMPQVSAPVRKERAARLRAAGEVAVRTFLAGRVGTTDRVVVEKDGVSGHTEHYAPVRLTASSVPGSLVPVRITAADGSGLMAEPVSPA